MPRVLLSFIFFYFLDVAMVGNKLCCKTSVVLTCRHSNMWRGISKDHTWNHRVKTRSETHSFKRKDALWRLFIYFWERIHSASHERQDSKQHPPPSDFWRAGNMRECLPAYHVRISANCKWYGGVILNWKQHRKTTEATGREDLKEVQLNLADNYWR